MDGAVVSFGAADGESEMSIEITWLKRLRRWSWQRFRRLPLVLQLLLGSAALGAILMSVFVGDMGLALMGTAIGISSIVTGAVIGPLTPNCLGNLHRHQGKAWAVNEKVTRTAPRSEWCRASAERTRCAAD